ncbi:Elongator subunit elp2 [Gnomoniopsis smithogilvyi]|uniref:Elongator complex protein 2 n=1 Tax=Gnomoniopsis smithogilvyi TaxID=1191159 RepID=A0A9W8YQD3_9PEZI|nr:Elongator subunit elp2 [Gnomoniopsis smithogilvyi]
MGDVRVVGDVDVDYLSAGANRQTAAGDWNIDGTVAFGTDTNIALWRPNDSRPRGIRKLLSGHSDLVKAIKFLPGKPGDDKAYLLSGSDDKTVKLWKLELTTGNACCIHTVQSHTSSINCIATVSSVHDETSIADCAVFATGAADATIKIWAFDGNEIKVIQTIKTSPKYFPLAVALSPLGSEGNTFILASAGTKDIIQIYTGTVTSSTTADGTTEYISDFTLQATLTGHEGWIRSLDFTPETPHTTNSDLLLASASQDKYIRLWRIHQGTELPAQAATASDPTVGAYLPGRSPANKAHRFKAGADYSVTFESLLFNHDDWIYSAKWQQSATSLQLLSTSADNSLAIWEADPSSGIWLTTARLGEISREKGATTATGSIGGFWTGLWSPMGTSLLTLGRTGSWRRWDWEAATAAWVQAVSVSGHTKPVTGIAWSPSGDYLLSTSADQTTRLHARASATKTWHEMARPQIHGYDLNCIDALSETRFVSGADEKLMRVFDEPRAVAKMLHAVAGIGSAEEAGDRPDAANMPVLGLSNKATVETEDASEAAAVNPEVDRSAVDPATIVRSSALDIEHPPFEESLSRHTLWPEIEKLYGHGYEISCLAASHDGKLIASACKASSLNHAVIRIFETERWTELRPPLAVHTLTATRLRFSADDRFLLSVGRDRQWAVFEKHETEKEGEMSYVLKQAEPKGHTRMILDGAWAPTADDIESKAFATAGRDKNVRVWALNEEGKFCLCTTIADEHPVTAVDFLSRPDQSGHFLLASGNDAGSVKIHTLKIHGTAASIVTTFALQPELCLPKAVLQLSWRPTVPNREDDGPELAIAGDDSSLRIYKIRMSQASNSISD